MAGFAFFIQLLEEGGVVEGAGAKVELFNTARAERERRRRAEEATQDSENENKKDGPEKETATSRPPSRY